MASKFNLMSSIKNELLNVDGSTQDIGGNQILPASQSGVEKFKLMSPIKNEVLNSDGTTSTLTGGGTPPAPVKIGFATLQTTTATPAPATATPLTFNVTDFTKANGYMELNSPNSIKILKEGIYNISLKLNAEKDGGGSVGDYFVGLGRLNVEPLKGSWNSFKPTETGGDISTHLLSGNTFFTVGEIIEIYHYETGSGNITLVDGTLNFPASMSISFLGEV